MLFGNRRKEKEKEKEGGRVIFRDWIEQEGDASEAPPPIQTLASFLEDFGRYAFDLEETDSRTVRRRCRQWARHILEGAPAPGTRSETDEPHWEGVQRFVQSQRKSERRYVEKNVGNLRSILWEFVHGLSGAMGDNQQADAKVEQRLGRLKEAAQGESIDTLKREIGEAVDVIGHALQQRRDRQRTQMKALGRKLRKMRGELIRARQEMATDSLTRLYNRSAFEEQLRRTTDLCLFSGQPACLLMVDADHFKSINDQYGHMAGDEVLKALADQCVRAFPRKTDFVARYGGEEFTIIISDAGLAPCRQLAERLIRAVRSQPVQHEEQQIQVTISVGVADLREGDTQKIWLKRADQALYRAKQNGRDRVEADG